MIDPRHGRRIPSGRRLARALARVFAGTWERVGPLVEAGYTPTVGILNDIIYRLAAPALGVELASGYAGTLRRSKHGRMGVAGLPGSRVRQRIFPALDHVKVLRFDPGNDPGLERAARAATAAVAPPLSPPRVVGNLLSESPRVLIDWTLFRPEVRVEAERLAFRLAGEVSLATRDMIRTAVSEGLQAGEPVDAIAKRIRAEAFSPRRAATIAQTEASRAMHAGQAVAARELGVTDWTWLASSDACDVCLSLDGKTVKIGEPFHVWPTGSPAYRVVYHAPAHPHCYCTNTEVIPDA